MPKLEVFKIEFDNPMAVFYAGTELKGKIVIVLNKSMEMRTVTVEFSGICRTHWEESRGKGRSSYEGGETYFNDEITVYGNPANVDGGPLSVMRAGTHTFQFTFPLPSTCASSVEGKYGCVRYVVFAVIDRPWKFNHRTKRPFTLLSTLDLNLVPNAIQPHTAHEQTTFSGCCSSGEITCEVHVQKRGYVAGEMITINANIINRSSQTVHLVTLSLWQMMTFSATCPSGSHRHEKFSKECIAEKVKEEKIRRGETQIWSDEGFRLPPVPTSTNDRNFICIEYMLQLKIFPSGIVKNPTVDFPIIVGSVPLRQQISQFQQIYRQFSIDQNTDQPGSSRFGILPTAPPGTAETYPELPPPAYTEATGARFSIKDDKDN